MRCHLLAALAALIVTNEANAQAWLVGLRVGEVRSRQLWRTNDPSQGSLALQTGKFDRATPDITAGVSLAYELNSMAALVGEVARTRKGARNEFEEVQADYVEVVGLLRLAIPDIIGPGVQLFAEGGPAPSREMSCSTMSEQTDVRGEKIRRISRDCSQWRDRLTDFGWVYAGGVMLRMPAYQLSFSMRRTDGVRDLLHNDRSVQRFNESRTVLIGFATRLK